MVYFQMMTVNFTNLVRVLQCIYVLYKHQNIPTLALRRNIIYKPYCTNIKTFQGHCTISTIYHVQK